MAPRLKVIRPYTTFHTRRELTRHGTTYPAGTTGYTIHFSRSAHVFCYLNSDFATGRVGSPLVPIDRDDIEFNEEDNDEPTY